MALCSAGRVREMREEWTARNLLCWCNDRYRCNVGKESSSGCLTSLVSGHTKGKTYAISMLGFQGCQTGRNSLLDKRHSCE
jgi:hypothetical protein